MSFSISNRVSGEEAGGESFLEFRASDLPADLVEVFLAFAFSLSCFAKLFLISFALFLSSQSKVWVFCIIYKILINLFVFCIICRILIAQLALCISYTEYL